MAEVKPIKITIEGVEKVLKSFEQIQKEARKLDILKFKDFKAQIDAMKTELESLKKSIESLNSKKGGSTNNDEASTFLGRAKNRIKKEVSEIGDDIDQLSSIGEKGVSTIKNIFKVLSDDTKSTSDKISDFGNSLADFANSFGLVGAAAGAAISVLTPLISSFFELSDGQKAINEATKEVSETIAKNTAILIENFDILENSNSLLYQKVEAIEEINKILPSYLRGLNVEKATLGQINDLREIAIVLIREEAIRKSFATKISQAKAKAINTEIDREVFLAKRTRELTAAGVAQSDIERILNEQRELNSAEFGDYADIIKDATDAVKDLEDAEKNLLQTTKNQLSARQKLTAATAASFGNQIKPKDSKKIEKPKNVAVFGESVDDLIKLLESGDLSAEETEIALASLIKASNEYAKTLDNVSDKVLRASDEIKKLNDENTELFKTRGELEAQYNQSSGLINITALKKNVDDNKKLLKELEDDYRNTDVTDFNAKAAFEEKYGVVFARMEFVDLQDKRVAAIKKAEKALKIASEQEVLLKQSTAVAISDIDNKLNQNKQSIANKKRLIDVADAEASIKIIHDNQKKIEEIQKTFAENSTKNFEIAIKEEIAARDGATKAELLANLASLNTFKDLLIQNTQNTISDIRSKINPTLQIINKDFKGAFSLDDDGVVENAEVVSKILKDGTNEQIQSYLVVRSAANLANREIRATNAKLSADLLNSELEFAEKYLANYKTLNSTELRFRKVKNEEIVAQQESELEKNLKLIKRIVDERRKAGETQSDDELRQILDSNRAAIEQNKLKYDALIELQILEDGKAIDELKKNGIDTELLERELALKLLKIKKDFYKDDEKLQEDYNKLLDKNQDVDNNKKQKISLKNATQITKELQNFGNIVFDIVQQNSQNIVDALNENLSMVEQRSTDVLSNIASLEDDLEGKRSGRRDAVLQALEQQKQLDIDLAKQKIKLAQDIEKEEIKIRKREQAAAITNAIINGALAITNIYATVPKPDFGIAAGILVGISAATTAAQVALIASQKFAKGGFTGDGFQTDETGHKVAGIVHNDEWVAPKWMVESPKFGGVINQLENARTKGFAEGGFTSPNFNSLSDSVSTNSTAKLESMFKSYTDAALELANRPNIVSVTEIQNVSNNSKRRRVNASI